MGKLKAKERAKFDRNVEISAPIVDPEIVRAIHSPHKLDLRHGGFKLLLSDEPAEGANQRARSPTGLVPTYEVGHLPSYIGISCAVSGYSNYSSSFGPRPLDDSTNTQSESNISKVSTSRLSSTPTPSGGRLSRTSSPSGPIVSHFKLDRSKISSIEQERRELTGLMTASIGDKLSRPRTPGPGEPPLVPPTEGDRHHGAYVGARYSPMPDPAEQVPKHIPLLGIDDEPNGQPEDEQQENKVGQVVAELYGEKFAEDWREDMSNKLKSEQQQQQPEAESVRL